MSILIKDMEMPERCLECPFYDNYNYYCTLYSFGIPARYNRDGSTRPEWCEIKELPERKKGKWIKLDIHAHLADHKCTACGQECYVPTCMGEPMYTYCPNCGCRMDGDVDET